MAEPSGEILNSWREIASYLGVSVKTAQLFERDRGLPVHRGPGSRATWAVQAELEAWKHQKVSEINKEGLDSRRFWFRGLLISFLFGGVAGVVYNGLIERWNLVRERPRPIQSRIADAIKVLKENSDQAAKVLMDVQGELTNRMNAL